MLGHEVMRAWAARLPFFVSEMDICGCEEEDHSKQACRCRNIGGHVLQLASIARVPTS